MKRYFLLSSLLSLSFVMMNSTGAYAAVIQQSSTQTEFPEAKAKRMVSEINLTVQLKGDEWGKVNSTCVAYYKKLDALDKQKLNPGDYSIQLTAARKTRDESLKGVLTQEQWSKWTTYRASHKEE